MVLQHDVQTLLIQHGLWREHLPEEATVLATTILPEGQNAELAQQVILAFRTVTQAQTSNTILQAQLCGYLRRICGLKVTEVAALVAETCKQWDLGYDWCSKLVRAGEMLIDYPQLGDLSVEKIATLRRVPQTMWDEVFATGNLPNGTNIRQLDKTALALAVNQLRTGEKMLVQRNAKNDAKQSVVHLANSINAVIDTLSAVPDFQPLVQQLAAWQNQLRELLNSCMNPLRKAAARETLTPSTSHASLSSSTNVNSTITTRVLSGDDCSRFRRV